MNGLIADAVYRPADIRKALRLGPKTITQWKSDGMPVIPIGESRNYLISGRQFIEWIEALSERAGCTDDEVSRAPTRSPGGEHRTARESQHSTALRQ